MNTKNKVALITGAAAGIGEATAQQLLQAAYKAYGTSRLRLLRRPAQRPTARRTGG